MNVTELFTINECRDVFYRYIGTGDSDDVCLERPNGGLVIVSEKLFHELDSYGRIKFVSKEQFRWDLFLLEYTTL